MSVPVHMQEENHWDATVCFMFLGFFFVFCLQHACLPHPFPFFPTLFYLSPWTNVVVFNTPPDLFVWFQHLHPLIRSHAIPVVWQMATTASLLTSELRLPLAWPKQNNGLIYGFLQSANFCHLTRGTVLLCMPEILLCPSRTCIHHAYHRSVVYYTSKKNYEPENGSDRTRKMFDYSLGCKLTRNTSNLDSEKTGSLYESITDLYCVSLLNSVFWIFAKVGLQSAPAPVIKAFISNIHYICFCTVILFLKARFHATLKFCRGSPFFFFF